MFAVVVVVLGVVFVCMFLCLFVCSFVCFVCLFLFFVLVIIVAVCFDSTLSIRCQSIEPTPGHESNSSFTLTSQAYCFFFFFCLLLSSPCLKAFHVREHAASE